MANDTCVCKGPGGIRLAVIIKDAFNISVFLCSLVLLDGRQCGSWKEVMRTDCSELILFAPFSGPYEMFSSTAAGNTAVFAQNSRVLKR